MLSDRTTPSSNRGCAGKDVGDDALSCHLKICMLRAPLKAVNVV